MRALARHGPDILPATAALRESLQEIGADGRFSGYASLFGRRDMAGDMVMPGAFASSLKARGAAGIRMLFQHDPAEPIGVWEEIAEDRRGLFVRGRLTLDVARAREVHALLKAGGLDGLSIGYRTLRGRKDRRAGIRRLYEIDLWEVSIVTFPMLTEARIVSVKTSEAGLSARFLDAARRLTPARPKAAGPKAVGPKAARIAGGRPAFS
ncbi:HK97 family phage prohead protease [Rhodopseudomonas julia]|uniref:HK97 family phage prohead protease n=1 Tax=Rhodopseudomonas julia TaxID=200617 RepID=A0ABU0C3L3_9BRAD|nr:HK97 family phage prohead protease [Rhodopseudomonas julia]MDQ0324531.1 HK97 family phage prohead protease [Rhodopseudomonas julia]